MMNCAIFIHTCMGTIADVQTEGKVLHVLCYGVAITVPPNSSVTRLSPRETLVTIFPSISFKVHSIL